MKKMFLGLSLLFAIGTLACGPQSNNNTSTPNANASPSGSPTIGSGNNNADVGTFDEVVVTITIADSPEKQPIITSVAPDPADLTGGMRVQWVVVNNSTVTVGQNVTVEIGSFKGKVNSGDTQPFGPDPCANSFKLNFIQEGKQSREISEQAAFEPGESAYTYEVVLKAEDGSELFRVTKRPEIIVGGMTKKPGVTPTATPKPSPTEKKKY